MLGLCFTSIPWDTYYWLATDDIAMLHEPDYIVLLGGSGVPGASGLLRTYYGADAAHMHSNANIIVAVPATEGFKGSTAELTGRELILRGVDPSRLDYEMEGKSTYGQAVAVKRMLGENAEQAHILIVTSPPHMKRALLTFRKAGFGEVGGYPAFECSIEGDMTYDDEDVEVPKAVKTIAPDIGNNLFLRYQFWGFLNYEFQIAREFSAMLYYKLKGWI